MLLRSIYGPQFEAAGDRVCRRRRRGVSGDPSMAYSGDVATIDAMLAPDAKSYPPGAPAVSGLPALHDFTVEYLEAGLTEFREETTDFYGNEEYVVDAGTYVVIYGPDNVTERGKYLNVWQQVDGEWKIKANMWNTSAPAPTPN